MCTGKRQTHIRNAPSSRTAVTGIGPYRQTGKYGSRDNRCTCALWSYRLSFPDGKGEAAFEAQPPARFPWTVFF